MLPVEGGARVAIVERADRLNEDAQSALLKTLEEPPSGVTIILCADRDDLLLPTVRSRCVRVRLGPVAIREIESLLEDAGAADASRAGRLARLAAGRPGAALTLAMAPDAVAARDEIARTLLDLTGARAARRLGVGRELLGRAAELAAALDRVGEVRLGAGDGAAPERKGRARRGASKAAAAAVEPIAASGSADTPAAEPGEDADADAETAEAAAVRAPATERRRAATTLVEIWRDVARDLLLVGLGEERRLRDPSLLDDLRATAIEPDEVRGFIARLARTAELLEANVSPELAIDALLLAWPGRAAAA